MKKENVFKFMGISSILILLCSQGCIPVDSDEQQRKFEEARTLWNTQNIESYSYMIVYGGFLPDNTLKIDVQKDSVFNVCLLVDDTYQSITEMQSCKTITGLFKEIESQSDKTNIKAIFNKEYGYPEDVYFDSGEEGWGYRIIWFSAKDFTITSY